MSIFSLYLAKTCILLITQGVIFGEMYYVNLAILVLLFLDVCILCQTPVRSSSHMCFHHISHTAGQHYEEGVIWLLEVL